MEARIRIEMENAAFDDDQDGHGELARILLDLAAQLDYRNGGTLTLSSTDPRPLRDFNGNTVGEIFLHKA
jgi:hypothetical protein